MGIDDGRLVDGLRSAMRGVRRVRSAGRATLVAAALMPCSFGALDGQSVRGLVLERDSDQVVALATVLMISESGDTVSSALTDENGFFLVRTDDDGRYTLVADALGYGAVASGPYEIGDDEDRVVQITLPLRPVELSGLTVEADEPELRGLAATGFYDRLAAGQGHYMLPGQIAASREIWTPQLFWEMDAEVAVVRQGGNGPWANRVLIRDVSGPALYCAPRIFIDGVWIRELNPGESLSDAVPKDELLGVEVYLDRSVPRRFARAFELDASGYPNTCGVVLFWTTAWAG